MLASFERSLTAKLDRPKMLLITANKSTEESSRMSENKAWVQLCSFHLHRGRSDEFMDLFEDRIVRIFRRHGAYITERARVLRKYENTEASYILIMGWPSAEAGPNAWKELDFDEEWTSIRHGLESEGILKKLESIHASKDLDDDRAETQ